MSSIQHNNLNDDEPLKQLLKEWDLEILYKTCIGKDKLLIIMFNL